MQPRIRHATDEERDRLLCRMEPRLDPTPYVFRTVDAVLLEGERGPAGTQSVRGLFREDEGLTLIEEIDPARSTAVGGEPVWARITLTVHSALAAVGFLAAVTGKLAAAGISVNPVSAYFHDHLFVPWNERERALAALTELASVAVAAERFRSDPVRSSLFAEETTMPENITFQSVSPIGDTDTNALPVEEIGPAVGYYTQVLGFTLVSRDGDAAVLRRDAVTIGLQRNSADPEQASCYFGVSDVDALREDLQAKGIEPSPLRVDTYGGKQYRVFFAKEPYGVCFCFGQQI